jgi:hypothetical protein
MSRHLSELARWKHRYSSDRKIQTVYLQLSECPQDFAGVKRRIDSARCQPGRFPMSKFAWMFVPLATTAIPSAETLPAWYPQECSMTDRCAAVESVAWFTPEGAAPRLTFKARELEAVVAKSFQVHPAQDGRMHVCMRYDPFGTLEVTCLMVPPSN